MISFNKLVFIEITEIDLFFCLRPKLGIRYAVWCPVIDPPVFLRLATKMVFLPRINAFAIAEKLQKLYKVLTLRC
jgi:hypothetical protein